MGAVTVPGLVKRKRTGGEPIVMLTAYDFPSAKLADSAGIDVLLVGDSLGNVVQGAATTLPVTLDEAVYHTALVSRAVERALVIGDMPFGSYHVSPEQAVAGAVRLIKEGGAAAVKLEGGGEWSAARIRAIVDAQIPLQAHIGLTPQSVHRMGGYKVQRAEQQLRDDARRVQDAGAFSVVLEGVPGGLAATITGELEIPTIGIGAGSGCDGQVLVWHDLLGLNPTDTPPPKFVKAYADLAGTIREALARYAADVRAREFPGDEHTYR
jgi:3-methyl-2-oxobutanoate hydroxymethyltransferase